MIAVLLAATLALDGPALGDASVHPRAGPAAGRGSDRPSLDEPAPLDATALAAFLERVRDVPPPLHDAEALAHWLDRYGPVEVDRRDACRTILSNSRFGGLSGLDQMTATVERCPTVPTGSPSRLLLTGREEGAREQERAAAVLERHLCPRLAACDALDRKVWAGEGGRTVVLVNLYVTFGVMLVDGPPPVLDGCRP